MRSYPDRDAWAQLCSLFDTGTELPPELRRVWLKSLGDDEPRAVEWLRRMLDDADRQQAGDLLERGPVLPPWVDDETAAEGSGFAGARGDAAAPLQPVAPAAAGASPAPKPRSSRSKSRSKARAGAGPVGGPGPAGGISSTSALKADADAFADSEAGNDADAGAREPQPAPRTLVPALTAGMQVGPWQLLSPMTASDSRVVQWRARRAQPQASGADVALQIPLQWRPRAALAEQLALLAMRAQSLAHPRIARLLEVGVASDGTPWLASELTEGEAIERWCRDRNLELPERRTLLEQLLDAAGSAHALGVVHGRVHPSQIVITPEGKLHWLNFGLDELLALLDAPPDADAPGIGPPPRAYLAPELRGPEPQAATAAADIHALGLIAFELLSNASPWQPPPGSDGTRTATGPRWPRPSELAGTPLLRRALRGELDAIIARATAADPAQRYGSVAEWLEDLTRAAANRPVAAMRGGFGYELECGVRRHPRLAAAGVVMAVMVALLVGGMAWKAWSWRHERDALAAALRNSEAVSLLLPDVLREQAQAGHDVDWSETLARAESVARSSLKDAPAGLGAALALLGRQQVEQGAFDAGRRLLAEAVPLLGHPDHQLEATCDEAWAQALQDERSEETEQRLRRISDNASVRPTSRAHCLVRLADLQQRGGRAREAYLTGSKAWAMWSQSPEKPAALALQVTRPLGMQSASLGRFRESPAWFERALQFAQALQQHNAEPGISLREQWAEVSLATGEPMRALELADTNLALLAGKDNTGPTDPATAPPVQQYLDAAEARVELHRLAEARAHLERALALAEARGDSPLRQRARCLMALAAAREPDAAAARRWLKDAQAEDPARGTDTRCRVAGIELALKQGLPTEAQREAERLLGNPEALPVGAEIQASLLRAESLLAARQYERALAAAQQVLQRARAWSQVEGAPPRPSLRGGQAAVLAAEAARATDALELAKETITYAVQQLNAAVPENHPWRQRALAAQEAIEAKARVKR